MKTIHTDKAPAAIGPYVQGKVVGNFLFASGQVPLSPETGEVVGKPSRTDGTSFKRILGRFWQKLGQILTMW